MRIHNAMVQHHLTGKKTDPLSVVLICTFYLCVLLCVDSLHRATQNSSKIVCRFECGWLFVSLLCVGPSVNWWFVLVTA